MTRQAVLSRRPSVSRDLDLLRELFAGTHEEFALLPADVRDVLVDMQFRAQRRQVLATHPHAVHEILVLDGRDVGRVVVDSSATVVRVLDISLQPAFRGRRIGSTVLREILDGSRALGRPVEAVVWSGNTAARRMAESAGFETVSDEGGYLTMLCG